MQFVPRRLTFERRLPPDWFAGRTYLVRSWHWKNDRAKLAFLRQLVSEWARDPEIRRIAVEVLRQRGVPQRDYAGQAAALLDFVQQSIYYVNEPDELLQSPRATLELGYGDCDDMAVLLAALCESVGLSTRFVLAGRKWRSDRMVRYIEGQRVPWFVEFSHIYLAIGVPPIQPTTWYAAEPTLRGAPLGYDVVLHGLPQQRMPELGAVDASAAPTTLREALATANVPAVIKLLPWEDILVGVVQGVLTTIVAAWIIRRMTR